MHNDKIKQ